MMKFGLLIRDGIENLIVGGWLDLALKKRMTEINVQIGVGLIE
jgi:hypothetical protein